MGRIGLYFLILTALPLNFLPSGRAQEKPAGKVQVIGFGPDVPSSGPRAEFLEEVAYYEQRYTRLAEAMPAEKYGWRPGEAVRSVGEVFAHITIANYGIANARVAARTPGVTFSFDPKAIMALAGDKPKLLQALKDSFAYFRKTILLLDDADADRPQILHHDHGTLWRASRPIHRLRAHERDRAALDGRGSEATAKARRQAEDVGFRRIEPSTMCTFASASTLWRSGGVQQLCATANQT